MKVKSLSRVRLFDTPWTVAYQAPPTMGFSRQEYWSGLPFPSPGDLPNPGIEPGSPTLEADALTSEPPSLERFKNPKSWWEGLKECSKNTSGPLFSILSPPQLAKFRVSAHTSTTSSRVPRLLQPHTPSSTFPP